MQRCTYLISSMYALSNVSRNTASAYSRTQDRVPVDGGGLPTFNLCSTYTAMSWPVPAAPMSGLLVTCGSVWFRVCAPVPPPVDRQHRVLQLPAGIPAPGLHLPHLPAQPHLERLPARVHRSVPPLRRHAAAHLHRLPGPRSSRVKCVCTAPRVTVGLSQGLAAGFSGLRPLSSSKEPGGELRRGDPLLSRAETGLLAFAHPWASSLIPFA